MLAHEKLDVYRCATEYIARVGPLLDALPAGSAAIRDQLERASLSVVANIAEGAGLRTPKEKSRHYAIARGSAMECAALLDVCRLRHLCTPDQQEAPKQLLARIASMLTRIMQPRAPADPALDEF